MKPIKDKKYYADRMGVKLNKKDTVEDIELREEEEWEESDNY